jgi:hypothetical protein
MPIAVALFFLRYSGRLPLTRSFVLFFPSWCVCEFFVSGPILWVARSTLALVQSFLTIPLLRHATLAQQIILLPATVTFLREAQYFRVLFFGFWRRYAVRFWSPHLFLCPATGFTMVSSLGTSRCSDSDSMSSEVCSSHSRRAAVVS